MIKGGLYVLKEIVIVSWYGENDVGGVERVTHYMKTAWQDICKINIIDLEMVKSNSKYGMWLGLHYALDAFVISIYTNKFIRKLAEKVKREDIIVITQGYNAPFVTADISLSHGNMRAFQMKVYNDKRWHFSQFFEKHAWNAAKCVIAVGEHVKQEAIDLYNVSPDKIRVMENCVDTDIFYPLSRKKDDSYYTVLFCGRLDKNKGLDKLLELANLIENQKNFFLLIATPNPVNSELFKDLSHVKVEIGLKRNEMNEFYNGGNVMFFPSLYEGMELVTLESLSSGVPVLGQNIGAIGDFWKRGQQGIKLMSDNMQENLMMMQQLSKQFQELPARISLHEDMVGNYSLAKYKDELNKLIINR